MRDMLALKHAHADGRAGGGRCGREQGELNTRMKVKALKRRRRREGCTTGRIYLLIGLVVQVIKL